MPIYEFQCQQCGQESEILVRSRNWAGAKCPKCGSKKLKKNFSLFAAGGGRASAEAPSCSGDSRSCCLCGTGKAHTH